MQSESENSIAIAPVTEGPAWVERQRLRRLHAAMIIFETTRSEFLLHWAQDELMHIVRDS